MDQMKWRPEFKPLMTHGSLLGSDYLSLANLKGVYEDAKEGGGQDCTLLRFLEDQS